MGEYPGMADLVRLSLSLPQPLLERLEGLMREQGYTNRSEFVRDMIRDHLVAHEWQSAQQETLGTVTLVYNHHIRQLSEKLIELQHHYYHAILAATHVHLDHNLYKIHCFIEAYHSNTCRSARILVACNYPNSPSQLSCRI